MDPVKNARLLGLQYQAVFDETVPYFVQPIVEQGVRDGSICTDHPQEFSEVIVLLANLWAGPMFRPGTAEQLRCRVDYYIDVVKALGLSPVSYTHLDVYKRQSRRNAGESGAKRDGRGRQDRQDKRDK